MEFPQKRGAREIPCAPLFDGKVGKSSGERTEHRTDRRQHKVKGEGCAMNSRVAELRCKEIINTRDGSRYGYLGDVELDLESGKVLALIVPGRRRLFGLLGREDDVLVPWCHIVQLGEDLILVQQSPAAPVQEKPPQP